MNLPFLAGCSGLLLLAACTLNEVDMPDSPCRRILRANPGRIPVDFVRAETGQLSVFRNFQLVGDSLRFGKDTLVARVGVQYSDAFEYTEQACPEDYLSPGAPGLSSIVLQRMGGKFRPSGHTELLPYDGYVELELHPDAPLLAFRGLRPPDGLSPPLYGRIAGFTVGSKTLDTVTVRVERTDGLRYWIYSAEAGPLAAGRMEADSSIRGWIRAD